MAPINDRSNETLNETARLFTESAVTSGEKQVLYASFNRSQKKNFPTIRSARLVLLAAAFGLLAAVCAIQFFPM
ncbi:MAG: hypothetical protein WAL90_09530 [Desulfobacterales bacterium]